MNLSAVTGIGTPCLACHLIIILYFFMNSFIEAILIKTHEMLLENDDLGHPLEHTKRKIKHLDEAVCSLRTHVIKNGFENEQEEILFFKKQKPEIISAGIAESRKHTILVNKPIGTAELQVSYFEEELRVAHNFLRSNSYYYQYYKNGLEDLDPLYFKRKSGALLIPFTEVTDTDAEFATPVSSLFARFIACEHVQQFLIRQIAEVKYSGLGVSNTIANGEGELKWTGDQINIVELAYGLWLTGQLNNGNASLNQIVRWLEQNLNVNIGIVQRRFAEIERRKRLSSTKFIDQMKKSILEKIESANA